MGKAMERMAWEKTMNICVSALQQLL